MGKIYCISDIHGRYEKYRAMLAKIDFRADDTLYVLGDVIDRGPDGLKILQDMMARDNVVPIMGDHELNATAFLPGLLEEVTEESVARMDEFGRNLFHEWILYHDGDPTLQVLSELSPEEREDILDYLQKFALYAEVEVDGRFFVLVHGGVDHFFPQKSLEDYEPTDLVFGPSRPWEDIAYWPDRIVVCGDASTSHLSDGNKMLRDDTWINLDCGYDGPLGCLCLDTMEEFYV